jgi:hypothetical protein
MTDIVHRQLVLDPPWRILFYIFYAGRPEQERSDAVDAAAEEIGSTK